MTFENILYMVKYLWLSTASSEMSRPVPLFSMNIGGQHPRHAKRASKARKYEQRYKCILSCFCMRRTMRLTSHFDGPFRAAVYNTASIQSPHDPLWKQFEDKSARHLLGILSMSLHPMG